EGRPLAHDSGCSAGPALSRPGAHGLHGFLKVRPTGDELRVRHFANQTRIGTELVENPRHFVLVVRHSSLVVHRSRTVAMPKPIRKTWRTATAPLGPRWCRSGIRSDIAT